MTPEVSVIIPAWNAAKHLTRCLESLIVETRDPLALEVIVVDNGSTDATAELLRSRFPMVRTITNERNLGIAAARNQGLRAARGAFLLNIDADTYVQQDAIRAMMTFMRQRSACGIVGCRLLYEDGSAQTSAWRFPTLFNELYLALYLHRLIRISAAERFVLHNWAHDRERQVDWVVAACMMARRTALDEVGLLDERYLHGADEPDLCLRLRQQGWEVWFTPRATAIHVGGKSVSLQAGRDYINPMRSKLLYFEKHHGPLSARAARGIAFIESAMRVLVWSVVWLLTPARRARTRLQLREHALRARDIVLGRV